MTSSVTTTTVAPTASYPSEAPATPISSTVVRQYVLNMTVTFSGTYWSSSLENNRSALVAALETDFAAALDIPTSNVVVTSLTIGSLVAALHVSNLTRNVTRGALDPQLMVSNASWSRVRDVYFAHAVSNASTSSPAVTAVNFTLLEATATGYTGGSIPTTVGHMSSCSTGCIVGFIVGAAVVVISAVVVAIVCKRRRQRRHGREEKQAPQGTEFSDIVVAKSSHVEV